MLNKRCFIIGHLSLGDQFIINGIVRYFASIYSFTYILCKRINLKSIISIYSDDKSIIPISIDTDNFIIENDHYLFDLYKDYDIFKIGILNNNWFLLKSNFIIDNLPYSFFETFYQQLNLEYNLRYKFEKINRNLNRENMYFKIIMKNYIKISNISNISNNDSHNDSNKYIFIHYQKDNIFNNNNNNLISNNIPIFHPNYNYYEKSIKSK